MQNPPVKVAKLDKGGLVLHCFGLSNLQLKWLNTI